MIKTETLEKIELRKDLKAHLIGIKKCHDIFEDFWYRKNAKATHEKLYQLSTKIYVITLPWISKDDRVYDILAMYYVIKKLDDFEIIKKTYLIPTKKSADQETIERLIRVKEEGIQSWKEFIKCFNTIEFEKQFKEECEAFTKIAEKNLFLESSEKRKRED